MDDLTTIDANQLGRDARGAYQFISTEYGERLVQRMVALHSGRTEQSQKAPTLEQRGLLASEAAGMKECIDLILKEAQLISSGALDQLEEAEANMTQ
jgi:hypothetical protein